MVEAQRRSITLTSVPAFTAPDGMDSASCAAILVYSAGVPTDFVRWLQDFFSQPIAGDGSGDRTKCGLGLPTAIWNLQRYGHFDPTVNCAASYELRSMMSNAEHLFVVVLDWKVRVCVVSFYFHSHSTRERHREPCLLALLRASLCV